MLKYRQKAVNLQRKKGVASRPYKALYIQYALILTSTEVVTSRPYKALYPVGTNE